jgi:hypothetical protein
MLQQLGLAERLTVIADVEMKLVARMRLTGTRRLTLVMNDQHGFVQIYVGGKKPWWRPN